MLSDGQATSRDESQSYDMDELEHPLDRRAKDLILHKIQEELKQFNSRGILQIYVDISLRQRSSAGAKVDAELDGRIQDFLAPSDTQAVRA